MSTAVGFRRDWVTRGITFRLQNCSMLNFFLNLTSSFSAPVQVLGCARVRVCAPVWLHATVRVCDPVWVPAPVRALIVQVSHQL